MIRLQLILVLLCYISLAAAACSASEGCFACVLDSRCGYCSGSGACMLGNETGPLNNATCINGWSFDTCECSEPKSCQACFQYNCMWCKGWDQKVGFCTILNNYTANATCPLQWTPNQICPSEVDDIAYLTFAVLGSALVIGLIALGVRWFWINKRGYFMRFKDEEPTSA